jgi:hypothetical protein
MVPREAGQGPAGASQGQEPRPVAARAGSCPSRRFWGWSPCGHGACPCGKAVAIEWRWRHGLPAVLDNWLEWTRGTQRRSAKSFPKIVTAAVALGWSGDTSSPSQPTFIDLEML